MAKTFEEIPLNREIPKEQVGNIPFGIFGHLGSPITYIILLSITGITVWSAIWTFLAVSLFFLLFTLACEKYNPSIDLPKATFKEIWLGLLQVFYNGLIVGGGFIALGWWLISLFSPISGTNTGWFFIITATVLTDMAYYWIHRTLSHSKGQHSLLRYYRKKHAAHHSVSEMDFFRGNQSSLVDTALSQFQPSLIIISGLMGMSLADTLVAYALVLALQATDHTNITFNIGILSYIFMDNHAHKLHHCRRGNLVNHGAGFAMWDRLWGTYYEDWNLSSNYLHHHRIALPIRPIKGPKTRNRQRQQPAPTA